MSNFCVIGSGPSAVSAAVALTRRNIPVTMLDAGRALDAARAGAVARLGSSEPELWNAADLRQIQEGADAPSNGIPLKRSYGSDFPFSAEGAGLRMDYRNAGVRPSFARGGLSNVWGGGILPFHSDDLAAWPFDAADLDQPYRDVLSFVPCAGSAGPPQTNPFDALFPLHSTDLQPLRPSRQGKAFLDDAASSEAALASRGIFIGQARLAVDGAQCRRCGMCLYGCPYGLIYNSESTLRRLAASPGFRYESGFVVDRLIEENSVVRIVGHDLITQVHREAVASRVLLGAGTVPSTAILLASLGDFNVRVRLQDSFYFLLPLLRFVGVEAAADEKLHTLVQAFIAMRNTTLSRQFIHFSIYGFNDLMRPSLETALGLSRVPEALVSRTLIAGGYLHSDLSPGLWMTIQPDRVLLEGEESSAAIAIAKKAAWTLLRQAFRLRTLPIVPAMRFLPPGRGFHTGGSFPMRKQPVRHTSDIEGRPFGFDKVHLIDASCLPSIPATTITLPVMANAWRIASLAANRA